MRPRRAEGVEAGDLANGQGMGRVCNDELQKARPQSAAMDLSGKGCGSTVRTASQPRFRRTVVDSGQPAAAPAAARRAHHARRLHPHGKSHCPPSGGDRATGRISRVRVVLTGTLSLGGGEKDRFLAIPQIVWSLVVLLVPLGLWTRRVRLASATDWPQSPRV